MATSDDFWLLLHDMANAVNSDHAPVDEKAVTLAGYFSLYPPMARRHLAEEFHLVLGVLSSLNGKMEGAEADGMANRPPQFVSSKRE